MVRTYLGMRVRNEGHVRVSIDGGPSFRLPHQPDLYPALVEPFDWGRKSVGANHLAAAILFDAYGSFDMARLWFKTFAKKVVASWEGDDFAYTHQQAIDWLVAEMQARLTRGEI